MSVGSTSWIRIYDYDRINEPGYTEHQKRDYKVIMEKF